MPNARPAAQLRPRKQPRQARSRDTVKAILEAAAQVFASRGYAATTTNHVAARAGVSIGSLYEYYPSKDALLVALADQHIAEGQAILEQVWAGLHTSRNMQEVVRRFARAMVELHANDRALHRLLFEEAPLPRKTRQRVVEIEAEACARLEALLRSQPRPTARDPALAAMVIVQCIDSLTHRMVLHGSDRGADVYVEEIVALVTGYLAAPASTDDAGTRRRGTGERVVPPPPGAALPPPADPQETAPGAQSPRISSPTTAARFDWFCAALDAEGTSNLP